jgi:hypothetical protein
VTSNQAAATAAGAVPAARVPPDAAVAATLPGRPFPLGATPGEHVGVAGTNSWWEPLDFTLPVTRPQARWRIEIDSYDLASSPGAPQDERKPGDAVTAGPRSVTVLRSGRQG